MLLHDTKEARRLKGIKGKSKKRGKVKVRQSPPYFQFSNFFNRVDRYKKKVNNLRGFGVLV